MVCPLGTWSFCARLGGNHAHACAARLAWSRGSGPGVGVWAWDLTRLGSLVVLSKYRSGGRNCLKEIHYKCTSLQVLYK